MNKMIKVKKPDVAEKLRASGFLYIKEKINNEDFYVFVTSPTLLNYINNNFEFGDFFLDDILRF